MLVLCIGVRMIVRVFAPKKVVTAQAVEGGENAEAVEAETQNCAFSSGESKYAGKTFSGGKFSCSFGSYKIDLRGATVTKGAVLDLNCAFGEIKVTLPAGVTVKLAKDSMLGAVNCNVTTSENADLIVKAMDEVIARKTVTYDFARLMEGAMEVSCSAFGKALADAM